MRWINLGFRTGLARVGIAPPKQRDAAALCAQIDGHARARLQQAITLEIAVTL